MDQIMLEHIMMPIKIKIVIMFIIGLMINGNTGQISFKTVIALFCEPYVHPLQLPSVKTVGEGRAIILHGGKMLDAKWKRGSNLDPFHIVDNNNNILYVPKGKVWISLVPNTKNPSFG